MHPEFPHRTRFTALHTAVALFACLAALADVPALAADDHSAHAAKTEAKPAEQIWTCSMHPQIRLPKPGKCPICGMDLVLAKSDDEADQAGPRELILSPYARKLAEIETARVERRFVSNEVRMIGRIKYDETRLGYVTAWVGGRLDRLYINYTGAPVKKGDSMVYIYSPDLLTAQEELLQSIEGAKAVRNSNLPDMRSTADKTVDAAREKLRLWGLTAEQVQEIERRGKTTDHMTITSPLTGIVISKDALEGMYVNTGTRIYTIADLSTVWLVLEAYESDLKWLRYGQDVGLEADAYPGETFTGKIAFIDPVLADATRTVKVRVNVPNPDGRLKPGMFGHGVVHVQLAEHGRVANPSLADKWISPQHPEIVKDAPGNCDVCGAPLVRAETLGYVTSDATPPLVIPAAAPLITGKRAVVYVEVAGKEGAYEGRDVVLGPRAGDYYLVEQGLRERELVVVNGNFKIDSSLQILAKPSMMNPGAGETAPGEEHTPTAPPAREGPALATPDQFKAQLDGVFAAYFDVQQALSHDKFPESQQATRKLADSLTGVDMKLLQGAVHMAWMKELENIRKSSGQLTAAADIDAARAAFATLSETMMAVARRFGTSGKQPIIRFHCPMAFNNRGADWLQNNKETENPYFGSAMPKCGAPMEVIR